MSIIDRIKTAATDFDVENIKPPLSVKLELSSVCNHRCVYCVVPTIKQPYTFMSDDVFHKSINDIKDFGIGEIGIFHMGEGTLHPKIVQYTEYIIKEIPTIKIFLTTNGTNINVLKQLVEKNINSIKFSLNGYNKEVHKKVTGVDNFDLIIDNLKNLIKYRNEINSSTEISASSICYDNDEQIKFSNEISNIVDNFYYTEIFNHAGKVDNKHIDVEDDKIITNLCVLPCYGMYTLCHIKPNGDVNLCKWGVDDEFVIGNILNNSLKSIWFSDYANDLRKKSSNGNLKTCNKCVGYNIKI
jgi:radical SAM protein with 4Fe4S-binding SPASM domain